MVTAITTARELKEFRTEASRDFKLYYDRVYEVPAGKTLADVSLEEGDALPDEAAAEIISASWIEEKVKGPEGQLIMVPSRRVRVQAMKWVAWSD